MKRSRSHLVVLFLLIGFAVLSVLFWAGCDQQQEVTGSATQDQSAPVLNKENARVRSVMAVQDRYTSDLMASPNVAGTATGLSSDGSVAIYVYLKEGGTTPVKGRGIAAAGIPREIEGIPVVTVVTGEFRAMKKGGGGHGGGGVSHTAKQTLPIQLGTSGGWRYDLANGYCCGGTLGSLIQKGGTQYVLSNYHVFYADIVNGGNNRTASAGDPVIQPGLIDVGCNQNNAQNVATLVNNGGSLPGANVDVGIAAVIPGAVSSQILEVGTISSQTVGASLDQAVKKSGRTTGLTRSKVAGLNANVSITYDNECAGGTAFTKVFTGQIVITNRGSKFLNSGDSGSLMLEDVSSNPRAVGLLYAGSSLYAIANPIDDVLSWVGGASMVGN